MFEKIEHIGIAVRNLDQVESLYKTLLGTASYKRETVASEHVITSFFGTGPNKIELLAATDEGIHHIAFAVEDIYSEMQRLKNEGFTLLNEEPKRGADNKLVCFVHPKSANGVLIELCQEIIEVSEE